MQTWKTIDKSEWALGYVCGDEPDKAQWIDEATGLDCLIVRGPVGALCGYVGVPQDHPAFEIDYDAVKNADGDYIDVHGGLTFADRCQPEDDPSRGICHTGNVANKTVWWLGFDCGHYGDTCPKYESVGRGIYRNFDYVKRQVGHLASQLAEPVIERKEQ